MAVKIENAQTDDVPFEYDCYMRLGPDAQKMGCVPVIHHLERQLNVGKLVVNALFMELLELPLDRYKTVFKFSMAEVAVSGLHLVTLQYFDIVLERSHFVKRKIN